MLRNGVTMSSHYRLLEKLGNRLFCLISERSSSSAVSAQSKREAARAAIARIDAENQAPVLEQKPRIPPILSSDAIKYDPLVDKFQRVHNYLRISLTEKCSLRCTYCMPSNGISLSKKHQLMTADEVLEITQLMARAGITKVRLTGGEPTVRRDLVDVIRGIKSIDGIESIGITTNGIAVARKLAPMVKAGLDKINISMDTLIPEKFTFITSIPGLSMVQSTIALAEELFPIVKVNVVVIKDLNDMEIIDFVELTRHRNLDIRFIEYMPFSGNDFNLDKFVDYRSILNNIFEKYNGRVVRLSDGANDTTKSYKIEGFTGRFGFITSMTEHFCSTCNRIRLTADGNLKVCLHGNSEVSLRDLVRAKTPHDEIVKVVRAAVERKKYKHRGMENLKALPNRPMILIGGRCNNVYNKLTHVSNDGSAHQVDVSNKHNSLRTAIASGSIKLPPAVVEQIKLNNNKKGDVLAVAKVASILASKQTANLIPLCHNISLSYVDTQFDLDEQNCILNITTTARTNSNTGVEMEALTSCSIAALTVYDMCKAITHDMVIQEIRLVSKTGGKSSFLRKF